MLYRKKKKLILSVALGPQCFLTVDEIKLHLPCFKFLELEETKGSDTEATETEQTLCEKV